MAATAIFPTLSVPEDTMEMSSPARDDGDIDLDFTEPDFDTAAEMQQDEHMLTDGEQTRPPTASDAVMDDDDAQLPAEEMHVSPDPDADQTLLPHEEDEELIDYGDEEVEYDQRIEGTTLVNVEEGFDNFDQPNHSAEHVDEEIPRAPEELGAEDIPAPAAVDFAEPVDPAAQPEFSAVLGDAALVQSKQADAGQQDSRAEDQVSEHSAATADAVEPGLSIETDLPAQHEGPVTPTDTGLHPMTVCYGEHILPLFKSKHQPDGLLKDDNLANISLHDFLRNCRERLRVKIGNIPEDQELSLAFDPMGLMLFENARAAFEHSLHDVLEVYLQLHQNDGTLEIPPLSLTLTHQSFSSQMSLLKQAAEEGTGMSAFMPGEEAEEYYDENGDEHEEDEQAYREHEQEHVEEQQDPEESQEGVEQYTEEPQGEYGEREEHHEFEIQGQEYNEGGEDGEGQDHDAANDHGEQEEQQDHIDFTSGNAAVDGHERAVDDADEPKPVADATHQPEANAARASTNDATVDNNAELDSTASSQTVQADTTCTAGNASKYQDSDEDELIDWANAPELDLTEQADPPADDLGDAKAAGAADSDDAPHEAAALDWQQPSGHEEIQLGSEDFLGEEEDHTDAAANADDLHDDHYLEEEHGQAHQPYETHTDTDEHAQQGSYEDQDGHHDQYQAEQADQDEDHQPQDGHGPLQQDDEPIANSHAAAQPAYTGQDPLALADEDDIGFDDDTTEQHEAKKASEQDSPAPGVAAATNGTPLGSKRSFTDLTADDEDELDFGEEEVEAKKLKSG